VRRTSLLSKFRHVETTDHREEQEFNGEGKDDDRKAKRKQETGREENRPLDKPDSPIRFS
jgi:hypothetical protein